MIKITLIRPAECHHSSAIKEILEMLQAEHATVAIEEIEATSAHGMMLIDEHQIQGNPGILINDILFSTGSISKEQLQEHIEMLVHSIKPQSS